jgi:hypothetical protein
MTMDDIDPLAGQVGKSKEVCKLACVAGRLLDHEVEC